MAIVKTAVRNQSDITSDAERLKEEEEKKFLVGALDGSKNLDTQSEPEEGPKTLLVRGVDAPLMKLLDEEAARKRISRAGMVRAILAKHYGVD